MQVNATLIAAQQAAREAQARFQANNVAPTQTSAKAGGTNFAAALQQEQGFAPLPLKQTAAPTAAPVPDAPSLSRPGSLVDIKV